MKAKKAFFLKYLNDNDFPKKNNSKIILENGSSENINNKNDDNNIIILNYNNNNNIKEKYTFEKFASEIKNYDFFQKTYWDNEARKYAINLDNKENIIKLTELSQINFKNPLDIISKEYLNEKYNTNLFEKEIINIEENIKKELNKTKDKNNDNNININTILIEKIIEKREKYEFYKKILKYYLDYLCINNMEMMDNPPINKIRLLTKITDFYYEKIHSKKKEILIMKRYNIDNAMKLILKKKKMENLLKIYSLSKYHILNLYNDLKQLKIKKLNYDFISYYNDINKLIEEIDNIGNNILNILNKDNNGFEKNTKKFNLINDIKKKLLRKKDKFNILINQEINNIFESKKSYIFHLYYLFDITNNNKTPNGNKDNNASFLIKMKNNFKNKAKKIILETLQNIYNSQNKGETPKILYNNKPKISNINNIILKEKNLIIYFINIFIKLKNLLDIFLFYNDSISSKEIKEKDFLIKYQNLKNEIKSEKNTFYEILDKYISKTIILIENITITDEESITKKNLFFIINIICLFEKLLKIKFNVKYNKFLNLALKNFLINKFKYENKKILEKSMTLLNNNIQEKKLLDKSIFQVESIREKIPFYLKRFIAFFNESEIKESWISKLIDIDNIDDIFNFIVVDVDENFYDNYVNDKNFDKIINSCLNKEGKKILEKEIENENNIIIFNKPLNYDKAYINNSSYLIIKNIEEQIINIIIFESLAYEVFDKLFNMIDLYILINFKIFIKDSKFLSKLSLNLNQEDIEKDQGNMDYFSHIIFFQKKFLEFKRLYNSAESIILNIFGDEINSNNENKNIFYTDLINKLNIKKDEDKTNKENGMTSNMNNNNEFDNKDSNQKDDKAISNVSNKNEGLGFFNFFYSNKTETKNNVEETKEELINDTKNKISKSNVKKFMFLISPIQTIKKILKRLISFSTKIELELERYEIIGKINKYEKLIEQIRNFFYLEISSNLIDFSKISYLIENYDWSPTPEEGSQKLFEASDWVKKLQIIFDIIINEIHTELFDIFGEKKLSEFFAALIKYIVSNIQESFSKIKKCNDMGRSIMLKDIKLLKEGIDASLKKYELNKNIKLNMLFDVIIQYANAWYYNSNELYQYIFNNNIQYKYFESIFISSPIINQITSDTKNDFLKKFKYKYSEKLKKNVNYINSNN